MTYPQTTWEKVLLLAPEIANAASLQSADAQALFLADALAMLNPGVWGARLELGQRYLVAHLATQSLRRGAAGQISDVGAGPAKISYAKTESDPHGPTSLDVTSYGMEFKRILRQLPAARFAIGGICG